MQFTVQFTCEAYWENNALVIYCPSLEAANFVAHAVEKGIMVKVKETENQSIVS